MLWQTLEFLKYHFKINYPVNISFRPFKFNLKDRFFSILFFLAFYLWEIKASFRHVLFIQSIIASCSKACMLWTQEPMKSLGTIHILLFKFHLGYFYFSEQFSDNYMHGRVSLQLLLTKKEFFVLMKLSYPFYNF